MKKLKFLIAFLVMIYSQKALSQIYFKQEQGKVYKIETKKDLVGVGIKNHLSQKELKELFEKNYLEVKREIRKPADFPKGILYNLVQEKTLVYSRFGTSQEFQIYEMPRKFLKFELFFDDTKSTRLILPSIMILYIFGIICFFSKMDESFAIGFVLTLFCLVAFRVFSSEAHIFRFLLLISPGVLLATILFFFKKKTKTPI